MFLITGRGKIAKEPNEKEKEVNILVECKRKSLKKTIAALKRKGFHHDETYAPVPMPDKDTVVIRGQVENEKVADLQSTRGVVAVWSDPKIGPFGPIQQ